MDEKVEVHVAEIPNKDYDVILGCEILELVNGYPKIVHGGWRIKLGEKSYRSERTTGFKNYVIVSDSTINKFKEDDTEVDFLKEFADVVYCEVNCYRKG